MYAQKQDLTHTINLHPSYFGPSVTPYLRSKLITDVEGTCTGRYGYIIAVVSIIDAGTGVIQPGNGVSEPLAAWLRRATGRRSPFPCTHTQCRWPSSKSSTAH